MYDTRTNKEVERYRMQSKKKLETLFVDFEDLVNRDVQENDLKIENKNSVYYNTLLNVAEKSFFRVVYKQAFEQVNMIVRQNQSKSQHDIQNIIAFTGRRGTGKTSAMLSIVNCLQDCTVIFEDMKVSSKFQKLAEINAANIDEYANIMSEALTQIIKFIDKKTDDIKSERIYDETISAKYHEFRNKACELLNRYNRCCSTAAVKNSDNSNFLNIVSGKLSFKEDFRKFMKDLSYSVFGDNNSYFFVCIDDIDMAPSGHTDIIKSIQTYLMIPNVIVLVTTELSFLIPEIRKNFYQNMLPYSDFNEIGMVSLEQTGEYLKKILPSDNRITMPSWRKKDYAEMLPIKLNMGSKEGISKFKIDFPKLEDCEFGKFMEKYEKERYQITPKELILMMIANRTKIYFDAKGHKYHFFEPMSLRNMYDLFYFLYNMNNVVPEYDELHPREKKGDDIPENNMYYLHRTENRKRLLDYIHFTMRKDLHFNGEDDDFIDALISQPIERRGKMIWERYHTLLQQDASLAERLKQAYGIDYYEDQKLRHDVTNYSFGELFRILFTSTRTGVFDNKLVKFIMATYSAALPAFVENEKHEEKWAYKDDINNGNYKRLVDLYGSSLLGSWCDDLFERKIEKDKILSGKCYIKLNIENNSISISTIFKLVLYILMSSKIVKGEVISVKSTASTYAIEAEIDPTSFFINSLWLKKNDDKIKFDDLDSSINTKSEDIYTFMEGILGGLSIKADSSFDDYFKTKRQYKDIYNTFSDYKNKKQKENLTKRIVEGMINLLIRDYEVYHLSNMLKHMDLTYNVIKRSLTDLIYVTPHDVIKRDEPFGKLIDPKIIISSFYNKVYEHLKENDEVYFSGSPKYSGDNGKKHFFSERFKNSILYKVFCENLFDAKEGDSMSNSPKKISPNIGGASGTEVCLSIDQLSTIYIISPKNTVKLGQVFDSIQPANIYIIFYSEFMSAIRGAFSAYLDGYISSGSASKISNCIMSHINKFIFVQYDTVSEEEQKELIKRLNDDIQLAISDIKEICNYSEPC